jgi:hypothetical protein
LWCGCGCGCMGADKPVANVLNVFHQFQPMSVQINLCSAQRAAGTSSIPVSAASRQAGVTSCCRAWRKMTLTHDGSDTQLSHSPSLPPSTCLSAFRDVVISHKRCGHVNKQTIENEALALTWLFSTTPIITPHTSVSAVCMRRAMVRHTCTAACATRGTRHVERTG